MDKTIGFNHSQLWGTDRQFKVVLSGWLSTLNWNHSILWQLDHCQLVVYVNIIDFSVSQFLAGPHRHAFMSKIENTEKVEMLLIFVTYTCTLSSITFCQLKHVSYSKNMKIDHICTNYSQIILQSMRKIRNEEFVLLTHINSYSFSQMI